MKFVDRVASTHNHPSPSSLCIPEVRRILAYCILNTLEAFSNQRLLLDFFKRFNILRSPEYQVRSSPRCISAASSLPFSSAWYYTSALQPRPPLRSIKYLDWRNGKCPISGNIESCTIPRSRSTDADSVFSSRYAPGWCCVDVIQHHKSNPSSNPYTLDIAVKDAAGAIIGGSAGQIGFPGQTINQFSMLPWVLLVTVGGADTDPVSFAYAGAYWDSFNGPCNTQRYGRESRQINCGFPC